MLAPPARRVEVSVIGRADSTGVTPRSARRLSSQGLMSGTFAVPTPRPTTGPALAICQFLAGPTYASFAGHQLLRILHPTNELIAGKRCDVPPRIERRGIGHQHLTQVPREWVHDSSGHPRTTHNATLVGAVHRQRATIVSATQAWLTAPAWQEMIDSWVAHGVVSDTTVIR